MPKPSYLPPHPLRGVQPAERAFYACTGDIDRGHGNECHWLRGVYDATADKWDWQVLVSVNSNSRYKSGGINFVDGQLYWAADANGPKLPDEKYDRGIFRCDPADLADPEKAHLLFDAEFEMANMIIEDGVILAGHCPPRIDLQDRHRHLARLGQDLGRVRPGRVRAAIPGPLPSEKQRWLVPGRSAKGMD